MDKTSSRRDRLRFGLRLSIYVLSAALSFVLGMGFQGSFGENPADRNGSGIGEIGAGETGEPDGAEVARPGAEATAAAPGAGETTPLAGGGKGPGETGPGEIADVVPAPPARGGVSTPSVSGQALHGTEGLAVPGVQVRFVEAGGDVARARGHQAPAAFTGTDGRFEAPLPTLAGRYTVLFDHPDFLPARVELDVRENASVALDPVFLSEGGTILGTVRAPNGAPVAAVEVRIDGLGRASVFTDGSGAFRFDLLPPGPHDLLVSAPGQESARAQVIVRDAEESTVEVTLSPLGKRVTGVVVDADSGEGIPGAELLVEGTVAGRTSERGEFDIDAGEADAPLLQVSHPAYESVAVRLGRETSLRIALRRVQAVTGRVFTRRGGKLVPLEGELFLLIEVDRSTGAAYYPPDLTTLRVAARGGDFAIPLSEGQRSIRRAFRRGGVSEEIAVPIPEVAGASLESDLVLSRSLGFEIQTVRLVDAPSGEPIAGVRLFADRRSHETFEEQVSQRPFVDRGMPLFYTTDDEGLVYLPSDFERSYGSSTKFLSFFHPRYLARSVRNTFLPPRRGARPIEIALQRGGTLLGSATGDHALGLAQRPHLTLETHDPPYKGRYSMFLDANGRFEVTALPPGQYLIRCRKTSHRIEVEAGRVAELNLR